MIGFSSANTIVSSDSDTISELKILNENLMDLLFQAVIEAEEEAVLNSMIAADTVVGLNSEIRYGLGEFLEEYLLKQ